MNLKHSLFVCLIIAFSFLPARAQGPPGSWQRYTVAKQEFSVVLPTLPAMTFIPPTKDDPWQIMIGAYADGVIYIVSVYENMRGQRSLSDFIAEQGEAFKNAPQKPIVVSGLGGREYFFSSWSRHQFFADRNCFYDFTVLNAAEDHPGAKTFFSSIAFGKNQKGIAVSDGPGTPYHAETGDTPVSGKEVERKARLGMKPEPRYTEEARQNQITGTVILKVVFSSGGNITNIRTVTGLPFGLTERAIEAAKKIKFIPAIKDGHYVSMWMQLEYNFNLY